MRTGARIAACLLLAALSRTAPALSDAPFPMREGHFEIPIRIDDTRRNDIKSLELYVSTDQGKTWNQAGVAKPDDKAFSYHAPTDGEYWFSVAIVDLQNRREPRQPNLAPIGQKVLVDTQRPEIKLRADRQGDVVNVNWEIREEHLDAPSLRLEWHAADGPDTWITVPASAGATGRTTIRSPEAIVVRAEVKDLAENVGKDEAKVPAAAGVVTASGPGLSSPAVPVTNTVEPLGGPPVPPVTPGVGTVQTAEKVAVPADTISGRVLVGASAKKALHGEFGVRRVSTAPPATPGMAGAAEELPFPAVPAAPTDSIPVAPTPPAVVERHPEPIAVTRPPVPAPTAPAAAVPLPTFGGEKETLPAPAGVTPVLPGLQMTNNRRVTMEYEVSKVGSSGVRSVDVYVTRDDGTTWTPIKGEHQAAAGESSAGVMRRTVSLDLAEDGIYGFYMVAKSGANLSKDPPHPGEAPQMRLRLDTKMPDAVLFEPGEDKSQKDAVLITWKAADENLADNPVTIQWADKPSGPWEFIGAAQLPNTGSFSWKATGNIPAKVYLRLTVRDQAGNVAIAETATPVSIDLSKPDISIRGLVGLRSR